MIIKHSSRSLIALLLACLMSTVGADKSEHHAAIVKANAQTQAFLADQKVEEALRNAESTYELSIDTLGYENVNTANLAIIYAQLLGSTGDKYKAKKMYSNAVNILEQKYGKDNVKVVPPLIGRGEYESKKQQVATVKRALDILRTQTPDDKLSYAYEARMASQYLIRQTEAREYAQELLYETLAIYENEYGKNSPELIDTLMLLGNSSARWGRSGKPKQYYRRALKIAENELSESQHAALLKQTGVSLLRYSASTDAQRYLKKSHKIFQQMYGDDDQRTALSALALGRYYMAADKYKRAEPLLTQALSVVETEPNYRNHQMVALTLLVEMHEERGHREKATPYCQAMGKISPWTDTQDYKPIFKRPPKYPSNAQSSAKEGYVILEYTVDKYGFVQDPYVIEFDGPKSFQTASLEAAERFRYAPAFVDGEPVATAGVRNKFTFKLFR